MRYIKVITWARWRVMDWPNHEHFTVFTASVLKPNFEYPVPAVSMSVVKGNNKVFTRFPSLDLLTKIYVVPDVYMNRLNNGWQQAIKEAGVLQAQLKAMIQMDDLAPGGKIIRTDTGEIIAEAERILKDHDKT